MALAVLYEGGQLIISDKPSREVGCNCARSAKLVMYLLPSLLQVLASHFKQ